MARRRYAAAPVGQRELQADPGRGDRALARRGVGGPGGNTRVAGRAGERQ
ncbi:MAG TPA: hypothetical protein VH186_01125 [Chloroflexia bacterium]|nr:hypothetical protein [Chloroflexia bacterium]